ncbi:MAG: RNA polymerase sigma factor [Candidatus Hydrogenedentes bacterium]|nr:RNA polymerase sigma factor [Candidatus Hydrogenedentota bacterium]
MSTDTSRTWDDASETPDGREADCILVQRAKQGDADAFSQLAARHQRVVYNLSYRFMRDATQAEDMAQEAFLKAYRMLDGFRGDCSFSTWMYRVTASVCLTELGRGKRRAEIEAQPWHEAHAPVNRVDWLDMPDVMRRCIALLPERYANIVTLYYLKERSYEEIADGLSIPTGTLKTWMHRARNQLRVILEKEFSLSGLL